MGHPNFLAGGVAETFLPAPLIPRGLGSTRRRTEGTPIIAAGPVVISVRVSFPHLLPDALVFGNAHERAASEGPLPLTRAGDPDSKIKRSSVFR
jgi:hypothetical protein